jgi:integrase
LADKVAATDKPLIIFDTEQAGFCLKITPAGHRTYQVRYRMGGRSTPLRTYTIGRHGSPLTAERARRQAEMLLLQVRQGIDPAVEKAKTAAEERGAVTLESVSADFMKLHTQAKRKVRTIKEYEKLFRNVILPVFGQRRIKDIVAGEIERWHHGMKTTPFQANRALAVLSKLMNWATSRGYRTGDNPCRAVEKFKELARKRYLSPAEIAAVGAAIRALESVDQLSQHLAAFFRVLLLTGMRKDELRLLNWQRVDLVRSVIVLEEANSKTGERDVPLSGPVRQILAGLIRVEGNPFVFVGKRTGRPIVNVSKPWKRILKVAGIQAARVHDLRHTAASIGVTTGASLLLIGGVLGHKSSQTTQRYAHLADHPVRATSEAIAERVAKALNAGSAAVVPLKRNE